jgi:hypothetical protein
LKLFEELIFPGHCLLTFLGCTSKPFSNFAASAFHLCLLIALDLCLGKSCWRRKAL